MLIYLSIDRLNELFDYIYEVQIYCFNGVYCIKRGLGQANPTSCVCLTLNSFMGHS